jgi:hypothetical protein
VTARFHFRPTRSDQPRPVEVLLLSGTMGLFAGLITLLVTRDMTLASTFFGLAFIVSIVVIAIFTMSFRSDDEQSGHSNDDMSSSSSRHTTVTQDIGDDPRR